MNFEQIFSQLNLEELENYQPEIYKHSFGYVFDRFLECDNRIVEAIDQLAHQEEALIKEIIISSLIKDKIKLKEDIEENSNVMNILKFNSKKESISNLTETTIFDWYRQNDHFIIEKVKELSKVEYSDDQICLFFVFEVLYRSYKEDLFSIYNSSQDNIISLYRDTELHKELQYSKYKLVEIFKDRELLTINPPRIFDKEINKTVFIKNVPFEIVSFFSSCYENNMIGSLAFRLSNCCIFEGKYEIVPLLEELEYGKKFAFKQLNNVILTKLYSHKFDDSLWIKIDNSNITFEEMCEDFEIYNKDSVVTQVLHIEYFEENEISYLKHIDHEYIFYTFDEYTERRENHNQKGHEKLKSFKADRCKIPLLHNEFGFVIYFILDKYFKHKDLLREYFELVLLNNGKEIVEKYC